MLQDPSEKYTNSTSLVQGYYSEILGKMHDVLTWPISDDGEAFSFKEGFHC